jgi:hypothetical protein
MQHAMIYPLVGMSLLTLGVALLTLAYRIRAVKQDGLNPLYFKLNRGGKPPEYMMRTEQHYQNLFEMPVLFYLVMVLILVLEWSDGLYVALAWLYVVTRLAHGVIHIKYNKLIQRRNVFLLSTLVLYSLWGRLLFQLLSH